MYTAIRVRSAILSPGGDLIPRPPCPHASWRRQAEFFVPCLIAHRRYVDFFAEWFASGSRGAVFACMLENVVQEIATIGRPV